jgi:hypothetical protein
MKSFIDKYGIEWFYIEKYDYYKQSLLMKILYWIAYPITPIAMKREARGYFIKEKEVKNGK